MAKWADFLITAVRYNSTNTHIDKVEIREDLGDSAGIPNTVSRADVVKMIDQGKTFITSTRDANGNCQKGAEVQVMKIETKYIKTRKDSSESDNLESLPSF